MPYIGKSPSNGVRNRFQYQATAGQTSFSGSDANSLTLTYTDSLYLDVYQNGILLVPGDDYTATTGTTVVLVQGASLNDIVHSVKVSPDLLAKPYLAPTYDEPEFVVRNIWRLYGGWYDGNPAQLKPARDALVAAELAKLSGGALKLAERARLLAETDSRLACHLVEFAVHAEPENKAVHQVRAEVYQYRRTTETSLMAKGIFGSAANQSRQISENE